MLKRCRLMVILPTGPKTVAELELSPNTAGRRFESPKVGPGIGRRIL